MVEMEWLLIFVMVLIFVICSYFNEETLFKKRNLSRCLVLSLLHENSLTINLLTMKLKGDYLLFVILFFLSITLVQSVTPVCQACHLIVSEIQKSMPHQPFDSVLSAIALQVCERKKIEDKIVCKGAITQMIDPIISSIWKRYVDPHEVCHKLYLCPKEYFKRNITEELEKIVKDKSNKLWEPITGKKTLKIMHISDLHPDFFYEVGSEANCTEPICCRASNSTKNLKAEVKKPAGYWGSLASCDLPMQTFELFLSEVKSIKPDFIIWTGDNTAHDIWAQSQSYNINFTTVLTQKLRSATNATVIPAMGNHESYPVNVYDYTNSREDMLKQALAQNWKNWIGEEAYEMLKTKGYYSLELPAYNNLKILSINTQAGNDMNWYLIKNPTDPGEMLAWMQEELKKSQDKGQFVYIIGHIPPNNNMNRWALRYNALIDRFSYTIRGQFYGHTHNDHIGVHYDLHNQSSIVNYYFVAPSLTTYDNRVPRYRVLDIDYDTLQAKDFHQYRLDIRKYQKKEDKAKFELLYSFKEAYGLGDIRPEGGITELISKLKTDTATQIKYASLHSGGTSTGKAGLYWYCNTFALPEQQAKCGGNTYKGGVVQRFGGQWKDLKHKQ